MLRKGLDLWFHHLENLDNELKQLKEDLKASQELNAHLEKQLEKVRKDNALLRTVNRINTVERIPLSQEEITSLVTEPS